MRSIRAAAVGFLFFWSSVALSTTSYVTVAGLLEKHSAEDSTEYGLSLRSHTIFYEKSGLFFDLNIPGQSLVISDLGLGYSWRRGSNLAFEFGPGLRWGVVPGLGVMLLAAIDYRVTSRLSVYFPFYYKSGGLGGLEFAPYLGWRF